MSTTTTKNQHMSKEEKAVLKAQFQLLGSASKVLGEENHPAFLAALAAIGSTLDPVVDRVKINNWYKKAKLGLPKTKTSLPPVPVLLPAPVLSPVAAPTRMLSPVKEERMEIISLSSPASSQSSLLGKRKREDGHCCASSLEAEELRAKVKALEEQLLQKDQQIILLESEVAKLQEAIEDESSLAGTALRASPLRPALRVRFEERISQSMSQDMDQVKFPVKLDESTVFEDDLERLEDGKFLNHRLIEFGLEFFYSYVMDPNLKDIIKVFNVARFTCFLEGDDAKRDRIVKKMKIGEQVQYVVLPINLDFHWTLAILDIQDRENVKVFHLDSFNQGRKNGTIRCALLMLADKITGLSVNRQVSYFNHRTLLLQQDNGFDCGLYLLEYAERFMEDPSSIEKITLCQRQPESFEDLLEMKELCSYKSSGLVDFLYFYQKVAGEKLPLQLERDITRLMSNTQILKSNKDDLLRYIKCKIDFIVQYETAHGNSEAAIKRFKDTLAQITAKQQTEVVFDFGSSQTTVNMNHYQASLFNMEETAYSKMSYELMHKKRRHLKWLICEIYLASQQGKNEKQYLTQVIQQYKHKRNID